MIRYLNQNEIDKEKWDDCIKNAFNSMVYASSWYLDIVTNDWEALVEDDYERVLPLVPGKKWGINYLFQPVFNQQLGVFSKNLLSEIKVGEFIKSIPAKYRFAEINFNTLNKIPEGDYKLFHWKNYELDLINTYENIYKGFSTNLKRNIKKAEKAKVSVVENIKPDEIIKIFQDNKGLEYNSLSENDYRVLKHLSYTGIYRGLVKTYGAFTENNELCAGIIFLKSQQKMIFLFSGLTTEGREIGAMPFLINYFIEQNSQSQITLDFEGSNDQNLARFYSSFGSKECTYPHLKINNLSPIVRFAVQLAKSLRK